MSSAAPALFDSESEVAAVVYRPNEDPDGVLDAFVQDLLRRDVDVVGALQRRGAALPDGRRRIDVVSIARHVRSDPRATDRAAPCSGWVDALRDELMLALDHQPGKAPDLVVLNRFGWLEACGGGLSGVIERAVARDLPVLVPVPEGLFERWVRRTQGLTVRLNCDRRSLERWWEGRSAATASTERYCQRVK